MLHFSNMTEWEKLGPALDKLVESKRSVNVELAKAMIPFLKAGLSRVPAVGTLYGGSIEFGWIKDYWHVIMSVDSHYKDREIEIIASLQLAAPEVHCLPYSKGNADQERVIVRTLSDCLERLYSN